VYNPAFDVTPGRLVTGFITEYGVLAPPYADSIFRPRASPALAAARRVKFYDFSRQGTQDRRAGDRRGEDAILAQRALDAVLDRLLPEDMRGLNCDVIEGPETDAIGRAAGDAVNAMPFLAERRRRGGAQLSAHARAAAPRLWAVAENVPAGNTLVLEDLFPPAKKTRPEPFGQLAGRKALRIDTTPNADVRERFGARDAGSSGREGAAARDRGVS